MQTSNKTKIVLLLTFIFLSACILPATAYIVSTEDATAIDDYAFQVDQKTSAEIVVCVFPSLTGHGVKDKQGNEIHDIIQLGVQLFNDEPLETPTGEQIGIGKSGKDNGVLIVLAVEEQQWRIEIGYGLEGDIPDIESNRIAQQYLVPELKQGNYGEALYDTVVALGQDIPTTNQTGTTTPRGAYYYESDSTTTSQTPWWSFLTTDFYGMPIWLIIILALLGVAIPIYRGGTSRGGRTGGGGSTGKW
jgi:uncharacterized membrane protein YgcG